MERLICVGEAEGIAGASLTNLANAELSSSAHHVEATSYIRAIGLKEWVQLRDPVWMVQPTM